MAISPKELPLRYMNQEPKKVRPLVREVRHGLMVPFYTQEPDLLSTDNLRIVDVTPYSPFLGQTHDVVNYSYNSRYVDGDEIVDLTAEEFNGSRTTHILAAVERVGEIDVVMGTLRFTSGKNLEIFDFFRMPEGRKWPHEEEDGIPGEIGKYSMHPVLDLLEENPDIRTEVLEYKYEMLRKLYPIGMEKLIQDGVTTPYFILGPHVKLFIQKAGIVPVRKIATIENDSIMALKIRKDFPKYWQPGYEKLKPAAYEAPKEIGPMLHAA